MVIFDEAYQPLSSGSQTYATDSPRPGWAEFDPELIWRKLCASVRRAVGGLNADVSKHNFCLSLSLFGEALIVCDKMGDPVYPGILSSDLRSAPIVDRLARDLGGSHLFAVTGRTPHTMAVITKIIWLKENRPESIGLRTLFLDLQAWLLTRMGIGTVTDYSSASGTMLFDIDEKAWCPDLLEYAGVEPFALPKVLQSGTLLGHPDSDASGDMGFPDEGRLQIVAGAMDQMCNAVGSGTVAPGDLVCSSGTVEAVTIVLDPRSRADSLMKFNMSKVPSAIADQYMTHILLWDGGRSLRWFCDNFAERQKEQAEDAGTSVYAQLLSSSSKAQNMFFMPHLSGSGTPWQNPASRGALLGLTTTSDVVSTAHAIIEGVTCELKLNMNNLESLGTQVSELRVVGGGSKSDQWLQLKADILQKDVFRLAVGEAGCMGAALLAGYGGGLLDDIAAASKRIVRTTDVFQPSDASDYYQRKYRIYEKIYPALEQINREISSLDG